MTTKLELRQWAVTYEKIAAAARKIAGRGDGFRIDIEPDLDAGQFIVVFTDLYDHATSTYLIGFEEIIEAHDG